MNQKEIDLILTDMGIDKDIRVLFAASPNMAPVVLEYYWKGITITPLGNGNVTIVGKTPSQVSKILAKQYPNERSSILIDEELENTKANLNNSLSPKENGNNEVISYKITSGSALICFLTELEYFHNCGTYDEESRRKFKVKQDILLNELTDEKRVLRIITPYYDTMQDPIIDLFFSPISIFVEELKEPLKKFHDVVCPFYSNADLLPIENISLEKHFTSPTKNNSKGKIVLNSGDVVSEFEICIDPSEKMLRYFLQYDDGVDIVRIEHNVGKFGTVNTLKMLRLTRENFIEIEEDDYDIPEIDGFDLEFDLLRGTVVANYSDDEKSEAKPIYDELFDLLKEELETATNVGKKEIFDKVTFNPKNKTKKRRSH